MRGGFITFLNMFHVDDPRAEEYFRIAMIVFLVLAVLACVFVVIHIRRRRKSKEFAEEIMWDCEAEEHRDDD